MCRVRACLATVPVWSCWKLLPINGVLVSKWTCNAYRDTILRQNFVLTLNWNCCWTGPKVWTTVALKWNATDKFWDFSTTDVVIWMNQSVVPKYSLGWVLWGGLQGIRVSLAMIIGAYYDHDGNGIIPTMPRMVTITCCHTLLIITDISAAHCASHLHTISLLGSHLHAAETRAWLSPVRFSSTHSNNALNTWQAFLKVALLCLLSLISSQSSELTAMAPSAIWTPVEETALVDFLVDNKAEAGDGGNFKKATFQRAANSIAPLCECGTAKTINNIQNKWTTASHFYHTYFWCRYSSSSIF